MNAMTVLPNPGMGNPDVARFGAMVQGVEGVIVIATALAARARPIDLAGLTDTIGLLCARALDLAPDDGRAVRASLAALNEKLDALEAALRQAAEAP